MGNEQGTKEDLIAIEGIEIQTDENGDVIISDGEGTIDPSESLDSLRKSIEESYGGSTTKEEKVNNKKDEDKLEIEDAVFYNGDEDALDALVRDPKAFNTFMNGIYKKAVETALGIVDNRVISRIPAVTKDMVSQQLSVRAAAEKFYQENEDLIPFKNTVGAFAAKVAKSNPQMKLDKVLENAEKLARKHLSLPKNPEGKVKDKEKGAEPRFPKKPTGDRGNTQGNKLTGMEKEIDDMLKVM